MYQGRERRGDESEKKREREARDVKEERDDLGVYTE